MAHLARMAKSDATRMVVAVGRPFVARKSDHATDITKRAHVEVQAQVLRARARCGPLSPSGAYLPHQPEPNVR